MKRIYRNATFIVGLVPDTRITQGHSLQWRDSLHALYTVSAQRGSLNARHGGQVEIRITDPTLTRDLRSPENRWFIASAPVLKNDENGPKI